MIRVEETFDDEQTDDANEDSDTSLDGIIDMGKKRKAETLEKLVEKMAKIQQKINAVVTTEEERNKIHEIVSKAAESGDVKPKQVQKMLQSGR